MEESGNRATLGASGSCHQLEELVRLRELRARDSQRLEISRSTCSWTCNHNPHWEDHPSQSHKEAPGVLLHINSASQTSQIPAPKSYPTPQCLYRPCPHGTKSPSYFNEDHLRVTVLLSGNTWERVLSPKAFITKPRTHLAIQVPASSSASVCVAVAPSQ